MAVKNRQPSQAIAGLAAELSKPLIFLALFPQLSPSSSPVSFPIQKCSEERSRQRSAGGGT